MRTASFLVLSLSSASHAWDIDSPLIFGDNNNHDGLADHHGARDEWHNRSNTELIFLPNIGDTNRRCSSMVTVTMPSDKDLDGCNDASDNELRDPRYLRLFRVAPTPPKLRDNATGSIVVTDKLAAEKVRIFHKVGDTWMFVTPNYTFSGTEAKEGISLGIDARDVRRPGGWDGRATIRFAVTDGNHVFKAAATARLAPVLTHHHGQRVEQVFTTSGKTGSHQKKFVRDVKDAAAAAGVEQPVFELDTDDIWTQDFFEPGYASMPGPDGPIVIRVMIRSAQDRPAGRLMYSHIRRNGVGAVKHYAYLNDTQLVDDAPPYTIDSTGNLETIPPYTHNGNSFPAGRVVLGSHGGQKPHMFEFIEAQEVQSPIEIDNSWLLVGHTDEFMQFLPATTQRGWVMMVADPIAGLEILQNAQRDGHGGVAALSRPRLEIDRYLCFPNNTIDEVLGFENFANVQEFSADNIATSIQVIKRETGLTDDEIWRVPSLFWTDKWRCNMGLETNRTAAQGPGTLDQMGDTGHATARGVSLDILEAAGQGTSLKLRAAKNGPDHMQVVALYPSAINGVVLNNSTYLAPNPWGPVIDGEDVLLKNITAAYAKAWYNVTYIDTWFSHHVLFGDAHCGSNTIREATGKWW
ncbi:Calcium permeable stress-gated cation channel 1 [Purpureocillium lavendulum]|uniref:Calcium permeable stress-gated cation channel 1 n=1 Tax=Purpureocillium lavendulum TaxID=1247861 RepID=A0AB34G1F1_9HYPO|nr:Calcium permeable stress-gated cation channel 1 [Purpureocillium lavendulum]